MTEATDTTGPGFRFASKAGTLAQLAERVAGARFCEQVTVGQPAWRADRERVVGRIVARFAPRRLAVRSSAAHEDGWAASHAGAHLSLIGIAAEPDPLAAAVDAVFASYRAPSAADQVLVQPVVEGTVISGVVLTRDLDTGSPYYVVNYDDVSGRTDTVTGGAESKTILVHRSRPDALRSPRMRRLIAGVAEIERVTGSEELDIEFCITAADEIYILQVRPLAARRRWQAIADSTLDAALDDVRARIAEAMVGKPGLAGSRTIFGEMPDWNPAEMIGNAPRPLALSLYRALITDRVWAEARAAMGYRRVAAPLLVDFRGRPYIDVRLSLNSFLPAEIEAALAEPLIDHQLARLAERRELHDKIEFEIAATCRDFNFARPRARFAGAGLGAADLERFEDALGRLTARALAEFPGGLRRLAAKARTLARRRGAAADAGARLRTFLADCRRLGTLPFSMLARHAFIGTALLKSLVERAALSREDAERFLRGIETIASELVRDMHAANAGTLARDAFLARYGHLRPGTYDITSWRYDERPDLYLGHAASEPPTRAPFVLGSRLEAAIERLLAEAGYAIAAEGLLGYIAAAIKAREAAKFAFSRSVSEALSLIGAWGKGLGLDRDALSFLTVDEILGADDAGRLGEAVARARESYAVTRAIRLPHLIVEPADIDVVRLPLGQPTFITARTVTGAPVRLSTGAVPAIDGRLVLIESADPGFDWIFSHGIAGLITKYGGANSHMAVRCAEFALPAAIGCGERLFETLARMAVIELDCAARKIRGH